MRHSVKVRVTLWYTTLATLALMFAFGMLLYSNKKEVASSSDIEDERVGAVFIIAENQEQEVISTDKSTRRDVLFWLGKSVPWVITFVFLIISMVLGRYVIVGRALSSISDIVEAATGILDGKDLNQRIVLKDGRRDGLYVVAEAFNDMLERLQKSFEREQQFTSDVSHELRTPIAVILSQCEFALEADEEEMREALKVIRQQSKSMSKMVSCLLDIARAAGGTQRILEEVLNLSELINLILDEMQALGDKKDIRVYGNIEENIHVKGDETRILRVFLNLISNGIHYGRHGGFVEVSLWQEGQTVYGTVRDNGIGIVKENLAKIWDRFYQVNPMAGPESGGSMGLGLAMVKEDVKIHNGSIWVESEPGEGTSFHMKLPIGINSD